MSGRIRPAPVFTPLDRALGHRLHTLHELGDPVSQAACPSAASTPTSEGGAWLGCRPGTDCEATPKNRTA